MSSLWYEMPGEGWKVLNIPKGDNLDEPNLLGEQVRILSFGTGSEGGVGLLVGPARTIRVNGQPVLAGLRVLEHKDEVLLDGRRFYFSSESTPVQVPFQLQVGTRRPTCPVCRGAIKDGEEAVQCPGCARWFHQREATEGQRAKTCWTYAPSCRFCNHPTSLSGEPTWKPEMEEAHV